jgi:hypothetical protein
MSEWTAIGTGAAITVTWPRSPDRHSTRARGVCLLRCPARGDARRSHVRRQLRGELGTDAEPHDRRRGSSWRGAGDWSAIDGTSTRTYRSSATERAYHFVTGQHTVYTAYQAAATAGTQTFGLTAPTGQKPTMVGIEIQDSGGGAAAPSVPRRIGKRQW